MVLKTRRAQDTRHIEGTTIEGIQCNSPDELADHHNLTKLSSHTQIHIQSDLFDKYRQYDLPVWDVLGTVNLWNHKEVDQNEICNCDTVHKTHSIQARYGRGSSHKTSRR